MADVKLSRPAQGQHIVVPSTPDARMILDFSADQVNIDRPEGSNSLFFQFGDGASIELQNFYTAYNKEEMPEFQIDGQIIAGTDFFQAFGPDLLPAAGPAASAERGARYSEYANMSLAEGTWHLNELDYRLAFDGRQSTDEWQHGVIDNLAPTFSTGGAPITLGLTETGWDGKSPASPAPSVTGSFTVQDPDGDSLTATVAIGGKTVVVSLAGPTTVESDYGSLVITPKGGGSNVTFNFEYTLKEEPYSKTDQLAQGEQVTDGIVITVNDGMGHTVTQPINVVITGSNDAPDITGVVSTLEGADGHTVKDDGVFGSKGDYDTGTIGGDETTPITNPGTGDGQMRLSVSGNILARDPDSDAELTFGFAESDGSELRDGSVLGTTPNGDAITVTHVAESGNTLTITTNCGTLTLTTKGAGAGSYTFDLDKDAKATNHLSEKQSVELTLRPTVTDNHGATDGNAGLTRPDANGASHAVNDLVITIKGSNDLPEVGSNSWGEYPGIIYEGSNVSIIGTIKATDVDADEGKALHYGFNVDGTMVTTVYVVPAGVDGDGKLVAGFVNTLIDNDGKSITNYYGTLTITGNGSGAEYTFELNNDAPCTQALDGHSSNAGGGIDWSSLQVAVPVVVMDEVGGYVQKDIHLTINGVNNAPVFTATVNNHEVKEEGVYSREYASGGSVLYASENGKTQPDGTDEWHHKLSVTGQVEATDVDGYGKSDTLTFGLCKTDGSAAANGTLHAYLENGNIEYSSDGPDETSNATYLGSLVMGADGIYTFTLNDKPGSPANALPEYDLNNSGSYLNLTFTPTVTDGDAPVSSRDPINITIKGSNDLPFFVKNNALANPKADGGDDGVVKWQKQSGPAAAGEVLENSIHKNSGTYYAQGSLEAKDPDTGDKLTYGFAYEGKLVTTLYAISDTNSSTGYIFSTKSSGNNYGTLTITDTNKITFTLDNKADCVQELDTGDKVIIKNIPLVVMDDKGAWSTATTSVVINGANDVPTFVMGGSSAYSHSVKESGVYAAGDHKGILDSSELTRTTDANGAAPGGSTTGEHHEFTVTGSVTATDVDKGETARLTYGLDLGGKQLGAEGNGDIIYVTAKYEKGEWTSTYTRDSSVENPGVGGTSNYLGKLVMTRDGTYTFILDDNGIANSIAENDKIVLVFTPAVHDGTTYNANGTNFEISDALPPIPSIKITVLGSNEAPVISPVSLDNQQYADKADSGILKYGVEENNTTNYINGQIVATDDDIGDKLTYGFKYFDTGKNADTLVDKLFVLPTTSGGYTFATSAPDGNNYGTIKITDNNSGKFTFILNNNADCVEKLSEGQSFTIENIPLAVMDDKGAWATTNTNLTIFGSNDKPVVSNITETVVEEGVNTGGNTFFAGTAAIGGILSATDVDADQKGIGFNFNITDGKTCSFTVDDHTYNVMCEKPEGTLYLNSKTGDYRFELNNANSNVQDLAQGDTGKVTFSYTATDVHKASSDEGIITINIIGTNDRPTLEFWDGAKKPLADGNLAVTEDSGAGQQATGTLGCHDDTGDSHTYHLVTEHIDSYYDTAAGQTRAASTPAADDTASSIKGIYGTLTVDPKTGDYTYTLDNDSEAVQSLNAKDHPTETFYVMVKDNHGAFDIKPVTVTVNGTDDPTILNTKWLTPDHAAIEKGVMPATGDLTAKAQYGNKQAAVPAKGYIGATDVDASDQAALQNPGADAKLHYQITVNGTTLDINNTLALSDCSSKSGWKVVTDSAGQKHLYVTTTYGKLDITAFDSDVLSDADKATFGSGPLPAFSYTFTANDKNSKVQELQYNENLHDGFTIKVTGTDSSNPAPEFRVDLTINGTNDRPEVVINETQPAINDTESALKGSLGATDVDDTKGFTWSLVKTGSHKAENLASDNVVMKGAHGWIELNSKTGEYTYHLTDTDQMAKLNSGEKDYDIFYVRVMDAHGAYSEIKELKITIDGTNHKGVLYGSSASGAEAGVTTADGYNAHGNLHFTSEEGRYLGANTAVKHKDASSDLKIDDDDNKYEGFHLSTVSTGANAGKVEVSINGAKEYCVSENGTIHTSYGDLTLDPNGHYTFAVDENAMNPLTPDDTVSIKVSVSADSTTTVKNADGTFTGADDKSHETVTGELVINIHGTNDAPVVNIGFDSLTVQYPDAFTHKATDKATDAHLMSVIAGPAAVDYLVTHNDLLIKYVGQEAAGLVDKLYKDGNFIIKGLIDSVGRNEVINLFVELANGANNALNDLGKLDDVLKATGRTDDVAKFLAQELAGRHVIVDSDEVAVWSASRGGTPVVRGTLNSEQIVADVDKKTTLSFFALEEDKNGTPTGNLAQSIKGVYGTLLIQTDGSYQYVLDVNSKAYQDFTKSHSIGGDASETFKIYVRDEHNAMAKDPIELVINVKAPSPSDGSGEGVSTGAMELIVHGTGAVTEDVAAKGIAIGTIRDSASTHGADSNLCFTGKYAQTGEGSELGASGKTNSIITDYGTITLLPDGSYTYIINNDHPKVQGLGLDESIVQTFFVQGSGGTKSEIQITINGTNDTPYLTSDGPVLSMHQSEAGGWDRTSASGSFTATDRDTNDAQKLSIQESDTVTKNGSSFSVKGEYGIYTITPASDTAGTKFTYTYELKDEYKNINFDGAANDTVKFLIRDGHDGTVEKSLTVALSAENAVPKLSATVDDLVVTEDSATNSMVPGTITADDGDSDHLSASSKLSYAIKGAEIPGMCQGKYGTLFLKDDGTYEYKLNNNDPHVQELGEGKTLEGETFIIRVSDGGKTADFTVNITVKGANDAPSITLHQADGTGAAGSGASLYVSETERHLDVNKLPSVSGKAAVYDVDKGDTKTFSIDGGDADSGKLTVYAYNDGKEWKQCGATAQDAVAIGTFGIDNNIDNKGVYTFTMSESAEALAHGDKVVLTANVVVTDSAGVTASAPVQVTVTGANTAPVINYFDNRILEDVTPASGNPYETPVLKGVITANDADRDAMSYFIKSGGHNVTELSNAYGTLKLDGSNYTFTLNAAGESLLKSLGQGEGLAAMDDASLITAFTFTLVAQDKYGEEDSKVLVIDLKGANDAPEVTATFTSETAIGSLTIKDLDVNDHHTLSISYGGQEYAMDAASHKVDVTDLGVFTFTEGTGGSWSYTFKADDTLAQGIRTGELGDTPYDLSIIVNDGVAKTEQDLSIHILGSNAAPVISTDAGDNLLGGIYATDDGKDLIFTLDSAHQPQFGTVTGNADGTYTYTLHTDESTLHLLSQAPVDADHITDTFGFSVSDGAVHGTPVSGTANVSIDLNNWDGSHGHLFFGTAEDNVLDKSSASGNNILFGGGGDDHLYGGAGDDYLFGGAGNDFLDGGTSNYDPVTGVGGNHLYGGDGNDVFVFHPNDVIVGGSIDSNGNLVDNNIDILLVSNDERGGLSIDDLFTHTKGIEVVVTGTGVDSLTDMHALLAKGMTIENNQLVLDHDEWHVGKSASDGAPYEWTNTAGDLTVTVHHTDNEEMVKNTMVTLTS